MIDDRETQVHTFHGSSENRNDGINDEYETRLRKSSEKRMVNRRMVNRGTRREDAIVVSSGS